MGKKGASHIDWVISVGVFIIYILLLLTWIKPSYKPVFEEVALIDIVKNGIIEKHTVTVSKSFVVFDGCAAGTNQKTIALSSYMPGVVADHFKVLKKDGTDANYISSASIGLQRAGKNEYWIIGSPFYSGYGTNPGSLPLGEDPSCGVVFGEPITKRGLSNINLPGFDPSTWSKKFPDSREFKVIVDDLAGNYAYFCRTATGSACENFEASGDLTVRSFEWNYNILDKDYNYDPVRINILIW